MATLTPRVCLKIVGAKGVGLHYTPDAVVATDVCELTQSEDERVIARTDASSMLCRLQRRLWSGGCDH